jgi:hypothetical protein
MVIKERLIVAGENKHSAFSTQHSAKQWFYKILLNLSHPRGWMQSAGRVWISQLPYAVQHYYFAEC